MTNDWPTGLKIEPIGEWPGTRLTRPVRSPFDSPIHSTLETLHRELRALEARDAALQVAISASQFRLDGYPRATAKAEHPGVILTFRSQVGALSYPCDTFDRWEDNLRAIALALEALRKVDRYGVTKRGEQYRGFLAIEGATAAPPAFANLAQAVGFLADTAGVQVQGNLANMPREAVTRYVRMAKRNSHPDHGGDAATFQRVMLAEAKLREAGRL